MKDCWCEEHLEEFCFSVLKIGEVLGEYVRGVRDCWQFWSFVVECGEFGGA